ncbi:MAG: TlpA disulfide reductase family protein [Candidatus Pedobacter colombiensis]|uniref:TlpA disulfide reductase family protein n=1 Tax=Candidatus Pedobacter colombiensis TaxID=3121371 RepID=A0AAJ5W8L1_9SPHI|nr:TlpA disulfide reductase family protein [Pedobacter sp.]WEK19929.1 MAG: TlpA disulfide reductase family protein [Pedobacter sp.]
MIKKGLTLAIAALLMVSSSFAQKGKTVTFTGHVKFPDTENKYPIYLGKYEGEGFKRAFKAYDSTKVDANNNFSFKVPADNPDFYQVRVYYFDRIDFWADKDNIHVNVRGIDTAKMKIKNPPYIYMENTSAANDVINDVNLVSYLDYQQMIAVGQEQYRAGLSKDSLWINYMKDGFDRISKDRDFRVKYLVNKYKDQPSVLYALNSLNPKRDQELIMSTLDHLTKKFPNLTQAKERKKEILDGIAQAAKIADGQKTPDFAYPDLNGKKWGPKDFRGKYLIIDFWASWCGPCRQEIPHLKEVYKKYKDKGLEILSVSVDAKPADWKKAMNEERMAWPQINAVESKPVMASYMFSGIPYLVVVDKDGKIVEKNVRGESLDKAMKKIFGM